MKAKRTLRSKKYRPTITLNDFKTSEEAEESEYFKHIETNIKELKGIKEDFKKL